MKNNKILIAIAAAGVIGAGGFGLYCLGIQQGMKASTATEGGSKAMRGIESTADGGGKRPLYWHDPMVPGQKFDKPGKSPFMDMQLVPVYGDDARDQGKVTISPRVQQNLGVRTADVIKGSFTSVVVTVGSVAYNERDVALVQARSNGFVERLFVRAPLDPVKKGQPLAELYVPDWVAAQEEYLTAKRMRDASIDGLLDGAQQRMRLAGMNDAQIRLIESSGKVHPRITITAPSDGVIAELAAREGMTVMAGAPLFRINGLSTVWVNAEVPENLSSLVRPGNAVEARTPALPGAIFRGKVSAILPEVNATTRTLKARIELSNPSGQLVPGMFATLNFAATGRTGVLLVPTEAVIQTGTRSVVMVAQGDGKFAPVDVETGFESSGQTEIKKGLEAGQKVVVSGQFLIDSEASLKGTATRMGEATVPDRGKASGATHHGEGKVEKIGKDEVTISHGPIASLQWGAMTMPFKLPPTGLPRNVAAGDSVTFDILPLNDGTYQITAISPTAEAPMQPMEMKGTTDGDMTRKAMPSSTNGAASKPMKNDLNVPAKAAGGKP